jgi:hypothetical protein
MRRSRADNTRAALVRRWIGLDKYQLTLCVQLHLLRQTPTLSSILQRWSAILPRLEGIVQKMLGLAANARSDSTEINVSRLNSTQKIIRGIYIKTQDKIERSVHRDYVHQRQALLPTQTLYALHSEEEASVLILLLEVWSVHNRIGSWRRQLRIFQQLLENSAKSKFPPIIIITAFKEKITLETIAKRLGDRYKVWVCYATSHLQMTIDTKTASQYLFDNRDVKVMASEGLLINWRNCCVMTNMDTDIHSADVEGRPSSEVALYDLVVQEDGQELWDGQDSDSKTPPGLTESCNDPLADKYSCTLFPFRYMRYQDLMDV